MSLPDINARREQGTIPPFQALLSPRQLLSPRGEKFHRVDNASPSEEGLEKIETVAKVKIPKLPSPSNFNGEKEAPLPPTSPKNKPIKPLPITPFIPFTRTATPPEDLFAYQDIRIHQRRQTFTNTMESKSYNDLLKGYFAFSEQKEKRPRSLEEPLTASDLSSNLFEVLEMGIAQSLETDATDKSIETDNSKVTEAAQKSTPPKLNKPYRTITHIATDPSELFNYENPDHIANIQQHKTVMKIAPRPTPTEWPTNNSKIIRSGVLSPRSSSGKRSPDRVEDATDVHTNPVFGIKHLDSISVKKQLAYLLQLPTKLLFTFSVENAESELSNAIREYPQNLDVILNAILTLRENTLEKKFQSKRFRKVLLLAMQRPQNIPFFIAYFAQSGEDIPKFVRKAFHKVKEEDRHIFLTLFSAATHFQLFDAVRPETRATLFREPTLSSHLGSVYGEYLLGDELKELDALIFSELEKRDPSKMMEDPALFSEFASTILEKVYTMQLSEDMRELLKIRRDLIIEFLQKNPLPSLEKGCEPKECEEDLFQNSRSFLAELYFLRILNPRITSLAAQADSQEKRHVLIQLSKLIQSIANENKFELLNEQKGHSIFGSMEEIYNEYLEVHRKFMDKHST